MPRTCLSRALQSPTLPRASCSARPHLWLTVHHPIADILPKNNIAVFRSGQRDVPIAIGEATTVQNIYSRLFGIVLLAFGILRDGSPRSHANMWSSSARVALAFSPLGQPKAEAAAARFLLTLHPLRAAWPAPTQVHRQLSAKAILRGYIKATQSSRGWRHRTSRA
jgi:hypothetical protein